MNRTLRTLLVANYKLKIASVVIAALLWLYVQNMGTGERRGVHATLKLRTPPDTVVMQGQEVLGDRPIELMLDLKGPRAALSMFGSLDGECDLGELGLGLDGLQGARRVQVPLRPRYFKQLGSAFSIVSPKQVGVDVDRLTVKRLKVVVQVGQVPAGYELASVTHEPHVDVEGPSSILAAAEEAKTPPVRVSALFLVQSVNLKEVLVNGVRLPTQDGILVTVRLARKSEKKLIKDVRLDFLLPQHRSFAGVRITDEEGKEIRTADVQVEGPPDEIEAIEASHLLAYVDLRELAHLQKFRNAPLDIKVQLPKGIRKVKTSPEDVRASSTK